MARKIVEYDLAVGSEEALPKIVNGFIERGFEPFGSIAAVLYEELTVPKTPSIFYAQAVVRYEEYDPEGI